MSIIVVTEKLSRSRMLAPILRAKWPAQQITFVHTHTFGNVTFSYPRGVRYNAFPNSSIPQYKIHDWERWRGIEVDAQGGVAPFEMSDSFFTAADSIIYACDPDHTGAMPFVALIERHFGSITGRSIPAMCLFALDVESIKKALNSMGDFNDLYRDQVAFGRVKRYFDWNWNVNSLGILSATLRHAGVGVNDRISKYALQFLYFLRQSVRLSESDAHYAMTRWSGTRKYEGRKTTISSPSSGSQILDDLISSGLIAMHAEAGKYYLTLTDIGRTFLASLHGDCKDANLPFRLTEWCGEGMDSAIPKIDRYIKTYFGKQKRFLADLLALEVSR